MTWDDMIVVEPLLDKLLDEAKHVDGSGKYFCANYVWFDRFKPRLSNLVGWDSKDKRLNSMECYDLAYQKIYKVLPPCKECICL